MTCYFIKKISERETWRTVAHCTRMKNGPDILLIAFQHGQFSISYIADEVKWERHTQSRNNEKQRNLVERDNHCTFTVQLDVCSCSHSLRNDKWIPQEKKSLRTLVVRNALAPVAKAITVQFTQYDWVCTESADTPKMLKKKLYWKSTPIHM